MEFKNCSVFNFDGALRGMRNPKNSWHLSDSYYNMIDDYDEGVLDVADNYIKDFDPELPYNDDKYKEYMDAQDKYVNYLIDNGTLRESNNYDYKDVAYIGPKDMRLAKQLIAAGPEHRKFLRQILVCVDITAPLYWWKEFDTYKVATVANSTSTMHKLTSKPITLDCFETGDFVNVTYPKEFQREDLKSDIDDDFVQMCLIPYLEYLRKSYVDMVKENPEDAKIYWKELVRWLPNGWLQTRTWTGNYETLRSMYHQRKNHKLTEWHQFCSFLETLPYAEDFIIN